MTKTTTRFSVARGSADGEHPAPRKVVCTQPRLAWASPGRIVVPRRTGCGDVGAVIADRSITPVFQPIFAAASGDAAGVDALARFPGDAPPDRWFECAQQSGVGVELELAAIETILGRVDDLPPNLYVACKASAATITDARLVDILVATGSAHRVVIELTEHRPVDDYEQLVAAVEALRRIDARFGIDDVGAGFATFAHVLGLRPDFVKIDMSLTRNLDTDRARRSVTRAIVSTGHHLGATVIAEGVETTAELRALVDAGVTQLQGVGLARPGPPPVPTHTSCFDHLPASSRRLASQLEAHHLAVTRFDVACHHSPIGMAVVDLDGRFVYANPKLCEILGRTPTDIESLTFQVITHPDDLDLDLELLDECLNGKRASYRITKRYLLPDRTHISAELAVAIVRSTTGTPLHFISQIRPIPDHQREPVLTRTPTDHTST